LSDATDVALLSREIALPSQVVRSLHNQGSASGDEREVPGRRRRSDPSQLARHIARY
jgi:hypothetical protein